MSEGGATDVASPRRTNAPQWDGDVVGNPDDSRDSVGERERERREREEGDHQPTTNDTSTSRSPAVSDIVLDTSSASGSAKANSDTRRLVHLLNAHGVSYRLVDLSDDTTTTPSDRISMLTASDCVDTLPQLHVGGKYVGLAEDVQEMEDFGELKRVLQGEDLDVIVESTKRAIEARLLEDREWSSKKRVARKSGGIGIDAIAASTASGLKLGRRNTPTQRDLEF